MSAKEQFRPSVAHFSAHEDGQPPAFAVPADIYCPLDENNLEIRLLDIEPGNPEEEVRCALRTVSLKAPYPREIEAFRKSLDAVKSALRAVGIDLRWSDILGATSGLRLPSKDVFLWGDRPHYIQQYESIVEPTRLRSTCKHTDAAASTAIEAYCTLQSFWELAARFASMPRSHIRSLYEYTTISYCWGDPTLRGTICLDGQRIDVPASSEAVIRAVRKQRGDTSGVPIWIDSICINQYDTDEKTKQVARMCDIYKRGFENIIYLGEDPDGKAAEQQALLNRILSRVDEAGAGLKEQIKLYWRNVGILPDGWEYSNLIEEADMNCLTPMYSLPWFSRVWTLQEAALSPRSTCTWGRTRISSLHRMLVPAAIWGRRVALQGSLPEPELHFQRANLMYHIVNETSCPNVEFHQLASWDLHGATVSRKATDIRDHVFGLHGLIASGFMEPLGQPKGPSNRRAEVLRLFAPDYRKSVREVYRDATRAMLLARGDSILHNIAFESDWEPKSLVPSWSVRWEQDQPLSVQLSEGCRAGMTQKASLEKLEIEIGSDPDVMVISGFLLEPITWTGESLAKLKGDLAAGDARSLDSLMEELQDRLHTLHGPHSGEISRPGLLMPEQIVEKALCVLLCGGLAYRGPQYPNVTTAMISLIKLRLELQKDDAMVDKVFAGWLPHQTSVKPSGCCGLPIPTVWLRAGRCRYPKEAWYSCRYCHGPSLTRLEQAMGPLLASKHESPKDERFRCAAKRPYLPAGEEMRERQDKIPRRGSVESSDQLQPAARDATQIQESDAPDDRQNGCLTGHTLARRIGFRPDKLSKLTVRANGSGTISTALKLTDEPEKSAADSVDLNLQGHFRPFALEDGYMGCGPNIVRPGDRIFIMRGGRFPHVVRPDGDYFRYIGVAYVHEMLEGEVFRMGLKPRSIAIR